MSRNVLANPIVQVTLALVVILVIATLTFAGAISGALKTLRGDFSLIFISGFFLNLMFVQTAEKLRKTLSSWNCNHSGRITRTCRTYLGIEEDGREVIPINAKHLTTSIISKGV